MDWLGCVKQVCVLMYLSPFGPGEDAVLRLLAQDLVDSLLIQVSPQLGVELGQC